MTQPDLAGRRERLRSVMEDKRLDALLVSSMTNLGYLTGFTGDDATFLLTPDRAIVVSDSRFRTQLEQECPDLEALIRPIGQPMAAGLVDLAKSLGLRSLGVESTVMTVDDFQTLQTGLDPVELRPVKGLVESLRRIKDAAEIEAIRHAIAIAERAFLRLRDWLRPGQSEKDAADSLEHTMRLEGASGASFPTIVAVDRRAALPHARATAETRIERDSSILVDWGADAGSYKSDLTRILVTGKVTPRFETVYRAVLDAQQRAIQAIKPGAIARDIDAEARSVIEAAGFGPQFVHSVGHGIGRDIHEAPMLRQTIETRLEAGMVVTIEPGIYLPDWGGIRIEDDVLVTSDGHEVLSSLPTSIESVIIPFA